MAAALGYALPQKAFSEHVEKEDRNTLIYKAFSKTEKAKLWKGNDFSNKVIINESGVYSLIFSSKLPQALVTVNCQLLKFLSQGTICFLG